MGATTNSGDGVVDGRLRYTLDSAAEVDPETFDRAASPTQPRSGTIPARFKSVSNAIDAFRESLDVAPEFIPFAGRGYNRVRVAYWIREYIGSLSPTRKYVSRSHLVNDLDVFENTYVSAATVIGPGMFLMNGAYPAESDQTAERRLHFANPHYVHQDTLPSVTAADERRAWLARYAALGWVNYETIAPHFGLTAPSSVSAVARRVDFDWQAERERGRNRIARTWAVCTQWGYDPDDLAAAFGVEPVTVETAVRDIRRDGFYPPARDPTVCDRLRDAFSHADVQVRADDRSRVEEAVAADAL